MNHSKFTVIKGGSEPDFGTRRFLSAYITDTRLMGVVGLQIHWERLEDGGAADFYQLFYYDAEEYGLDSYKSYR